MKTEKAHMRNREESLDPLKSPFLDLTRDYAFKIVMADPTKPELMMQLLNELIPERDIVSINFLNTEVLPDDEEYHRNNYDIQCTDRDGNCFIVEMQKEPYEHFRDRLMVYSGDPLKRLLKRGEAYDKVRTLYMVCILGGYLHIEGEDPSFRHELVRRAYVRIDKSNKILSDKLKYIFLQIPKAKEPTDGSSFLERWAYYVRTMGKVESKPVGLAPYFDRLFDAANRSNIEQGKLSIYDRMVRDEIQIEAEKQYAIKEALDDFSIRKEAEKQYAIKEALETKVCETARNMKTAGIAIELISQCTGLTIEQVAEL